MIIEGLHDSVLSWTAHWTFLMLTEEVLITNWLIGLEGKERRIKDNPQVSRLGKLEIYYGCKSTGVGHLHLTTSSVRTGTPSAYHCYFS